MPAEPPGVPPAPPMPPPPAPAAAGREYRCRVGGDRIRGLGFLRTLPRLDRQRAGGRVEDSTASPNPALAAIASVSTLAVAAVAACAIRPADAAGAAITLTADTSDGTVSAHGVVGFEIDHQTGERCTAGVEQTAAESFITRAAQAPDAAETSDAIASLLSGTGRSAVAACAAASDAPRAAVTANRLVVQEVTGSRRL